MQRASSLPDKWRIAIFFLTALLVIAADQFSKVWIRYHLEVNQSFPEAGLLRITYVRNSGSAFGLFQGQSLLLTIVAVLGIAILLLYALVIYRRFPFLNTTFGKLALGLILGGTIGNLSDRLRLGYITDFIDVGFWPAFNIADSAIVIGAIIFAYSLLFAARPGKYQVADR